MGFEVEVENAFIDATLSHYAGNPCESLLYRQKDFHFHAQQIQTFAILDDICSACSSKLMEQVFTNELIRPWVDKNTFWDADWI